MWRAAAKVAAITAAGITADVTPATTDIATVAAAGDFHHAVIGGRHNPVGICDHRLGVIMHEHALLRRPIVMVVIRHDDIVHDHIVARRVLNDIHMRTIGDVHLVVMPIDIVVDEGE